MNMITNLLELRERNQKYLSTKTINYNFIKQFNKQFYNI